MGGVKELSIFYIALPLYLDPCLEGEPGAQYEKRTDRVPLYILPPPRKRPPTSILAHLFWVIRQYVLPGGYYEFN